MGQLGSAIHVWPHDLFQDDQFCAICLYDRLKHCEAALKSLRTAQVAWQQGCHVSCNCLRKNLSLSWMFLQCSNLQTFTPTWNWKIWGVSGCACSDFWKTSWRDGVCVWKGPKYAKVLERDMGDIWSYEKFSQSMAIRIYNMCPFWLYT